MNWPYTYGAAQLDVRYVASSATATPQWIALYASVSMKAVRHLRCARSLMPLPVGLANGKASPQRG